MKGFIRIAIASQHEKNLRCGRLQRTFAKPFEGARCWRKNDNRYEPKARHHILQRCWNCLGGSNNTLKKHKLKCTTTFCKQMKFCGCCNMFIGPFLWGLDTIWQMGPRWTKQLCQLCGSGRFVFVSWNFRASRSLNPLAPKWLGKFKSRNPGSMMELPDS